MKLSQKRAIYYAQRDRLLKRIEDNGLLDDFKRYNKGKNICVLFLFTPHWTFRFVEEVK